MVALSVEALVQEPPAVASESVVLPLAHNVIVPVIAETAGRAVTVTVPVELLAAVQLPLATTAL